MTFSAEYGVLTTTLIGGGFSYDSREKADGLKASDRQAEKRSLTAGRRIEGGHTCMRETRLRTRARTRKAARKPVTRRDNISLEKPVFSPRTPGFLPRRRPYRPRFCPIGGPFPGKIGRKTRPRGLNAAGNPAFPPGSGQRCPTHRPVSAGEGVLPPSDRPGFPPRFRPPARIATPTARHTPRFSARRLRLRPVRHTAPG